MHSIPAFPSPAVLAPDGSTEQYGTPGISVREYFAALAMQGLIACPTGSDSLQEIADVAVKMADALIEALKK